MRVDWKDGAKENQLRELWPIKTAAEVASVMGLTVHAVSAKAFALHIRKDPDFLRKQMRANRYSGMWA